MNRFRLATLISLDEDSLPQDRLSQEELHNISLKDYLARRSNPEANELFIFDQFEEILSLDPADRTSKQEFFTQLGLVLENRRRWAIFAIREDYLGALEPYRIIIPTRFSVTYRLDLLNLQQSRQAIQEPAIQAGGSFNKKAAERLIDDLSRVIVHNPTGAPEHISGNNIEPVQLQVVCYSLWERKLKENRQRGEFTSITIEDIEASGGVDNVLAGYYAQQVMEASKRTGASERDIRDWISRELITVEGLRGQVLRQSERTSDLPNKVIQLLGGSSNAEPPR
ncbi:MAG: hypothetical protein HC828_21965, partial [Blastochloris sp.]|nr:hypothetical protein [Blastochloris sp.]